MTGLDEEIARRTERGWRVESHAGTTATLVKPKRFNLLVFFLLLGLFYIPFYIAKREERVFLTETPEGLSVRSSNPRRRRAQRNRAVFAGLGHLTVASVLLAVRATRWSDRRLRAPAWRRYRALPGRWQLGIAAAPPLLLVAMAVAGSFVPAPAETTGDGAPIAGMAAADATAQAPTTSTAATVVATTPAPANASALRLTGFGALDADWDARHTMVRTPGATPGAAYDPLTDWSSRFDGVEHTQGRVVGFGMNWLEPGVEWRVARDEVLALLPPDAVLVEEGPCSEGKHFLFHSATLGEAFDAGDALQTSDGDRIGSGGYVVVGLYSFDGPFTGDIDTAIVMIGSEHLNPNGC